MLKIELLQNGGFRGHGEWSSAGSIIGGFAKKRRVG